MSNIFNNREFAVGILTLILILWVARKSEVRKAFSSIINAFFKWKILTIFGLFGGYVLFCTYVLYTFAIWDVSQIKNTVIWSIFVGAAALFGINNINKDNSYFLSSFKQQFKVTVFVEFLVAFYTFSLPTELILVFFSTLLVCVSVYAEFNQEHHKAKVIVDSILSIFGITLLLYSLWVTNTDAGKFTQFSTFQNFVVPILFTIMLLPFLYVLSKLIAYDSAYFKVYIYTELPARRRYAIFTSLVAFKGNIELIDKWLRYSCIPEFESNETVKESIKNYKEKLRLEQTV